MTYVKDMGFECTVSDKLRGATLTLSMTTVSDDIQKWTGKLRYKSGNQTSGFEYHVETGSGVEFYPFEVASESHTATDFDLRLQNEESSHHFGFTPVSEKNHIDTKAFNLTLPPLRVLRLCKEYRQTGLTPNLVEEIKDVFNKQEQHLNLFEFISNSKYCLCYSDFIGLLEDVSKQNERARSWLAKDRHSFFKNIAIGAKAGNQFPVNSFNQLEERIAEYESRPHLKKVEVKRVIAKLLDDAAKEPGQKIGQMTNFKLPFEEFISELEESYVVQLLAAAVNKEIDISDQDLVEIYFEENDPGRGGPFALLRQEAYDGDPDPDLWKATLAYSLNQEKQEYNEACGNFLYWYAIKNDDIDLKLKPDIYAAAKTKFNKWTGGPDHMPCLAAYREHYLRGIILKRSDHYNEARESFRKAEQVAASPAVDKRINGHKPFVKRTLTDIESNIKTGNFSDAIDVAEAGQARLQEDYNRSPQQYHYALLNAWENDIRAQRQMQEGCFESALETSQQAASGFEEVNKPRLAQVARAREFQVKAYMAQARRDFTEASTHHDTIGRGEFPDLPPQMKSFHQMQANLCSVKAALVDRELEEAERAVEQLEDQYSARSEVQNISSLIHVYQDYLNGDLTDVGQIIEEFEIEDKENERFRAYHGDYLSSAIFISFAQQVKASGSEIGDALDAMISYAIEYAVTGSELSDWQLNIFTESQEQPEATTEEMIYRLIEKGENKQIEFKETLLYDVRQDKAVKYLKKQAVKEICAFANADGGKLLIGVSDDKEIKGLERDLEIADDLDDLKIRLSQEIATRIGKAKAASYTEIEFVNIEDTILCVVDVESGDEPVYYEDEEFYVRQGTSKRSLETPEAVEYISNDIY